MSKCINCKEKSALFNYANLKPKYCKKCSSEDMIDLINKKCEYENCNKGRTFNYKGEKKRRFCSIHKLEGMVDIHKKYCLFENCQNPRNYNYKNEKKGVYCSIHKKENMIDVSHPTCIVDECYVSAHFNYEEEKKGLYCNTHKKENMINVISKNCLYEGCKTRPLFNYNGEKTPIYCSEHKLIDMIDLRHKKCEHQDCKISGYFNYEGEKKGRFCSKHKEKGMIDVLHDICKEKNCYKAASFNYEGSKKGLFCSVHKEENMVDVKRKKCIVCNLTTGWIENKYCRPCFLFYNPDHKSNKSFIYKQKEIVKDLQEEFKIDSTDTQIKGGCSRRRPDVIIDRLSHVIIVEIDEDQHKYYNKECEEKRLQDLYEDLGYRPIVLIRFNPDKYFKHDIKIDGMFDKQKRKRIVEYETRMCELKSTIAVYIESVPIEHFTIKYLFYD